MTILEKIINSKIEEVKVLKKLYSIEDLEKRSLFQNLSHTLLWICRS